MARARNLPIIEDVLYNELHERAECRRALKSFDTTGQVMLCGSFSKTLAPGLRLGWVEAGRWSAQVRRLKSALSEMQRHATHAPEAVAADQRFHLCLAEASGNSALLMVVQQLWEARTGPLYTQMESHFSGEAVWKQAVEEHGELLQAVAGRDPRAARDAMRKHMKNAEVRFASGWKPGD
jgi:DNA-binding transcriptional MocR family regulator